MDASLTDLAVAPRTPRHHLWRRKPSRSRWAYGASRRSFRKNRAPRTSPPAADRSRTPPLPPAPQLHQSAWADWKWGAV